MLDPARARLVAATINNKIYAVGGGSLSGAYANVDVYNVAANTWSRGQPLPGGRRSPNGASVINGKIHVTGGFRVQSDDTEKFTKTLFVYDPATNLWVSKADMPLPGVAGVQGVINGLLYVYTVTDVDTHDALFRYNPASNVWVTLARPPHRHEEAAGGVLNGKLYLVSGRNENQGFTAAVHAYDPATNTWTAKAGLPIWRRGAPSAVINGKLYVAGGFSDGGTEIRNVNAYNPVNNTWATKAPLPSPQGAGAGAKAGGRLFVLGGGFIIPRKVVLAYTP